MKINYKHLLVIVPVFSLFSDAIGHFFGGAITYIRAVILLAIILLFIKKNDGIKLDLFGVSLLIFLVYLFITGTINTSNLTFTLSGYISVLISILFYLISYDKFKFKLDLKKFYPWITFIPLIYIINVLLLTYFNIGDAIYADESYLKFGGLHRSSLYLGTLGVVLFFVLYKYRTTKYYHTILIGILMIIILLSFRRTAIILILVSYVIYLSISNKKLVLKQLIVLCLMLLVTLPLYKDTLQLVVEARGQRALFQSGVQTEGRIMEIKVINDRVLSFEDKNYSFFGFELFNSFGTYATLNFRAPPTRVLHSDYAVILHGSGLVGLLLYLTCIVILIFKAYKYSRKFGLNNDISILLWISISFILISLISGGILSITYRTGYFILLGVIVRAADEDLKNIKRLKKRYSTDNFDTYSN